MRDHWFAMALVVASLPASLLAQGHRLSFDHLTLEDGLSQASVYAILQDHRGFMWFGTQDGLNRYDGYDFKVYKSQPDNPDSLRSNTIQELHEDRSGTLWIGTWEGGLHRYDRGRDTFTAWRHDGADPASLSSNTIHAIHEDREGALWIGTEGGGLERFDPQPGTFTHHLNDPADPASLSSNTVYAIHQDETGALWIGTEGGGLNRLDPATGAFTVYKHDPADPASLSSDVVYDICEDHQGILWIATWEGGLNRFDPAAGTFTAYRHDPADPASLGDSRILAVHERRDGVLWVGTSGDGLNRFDVETGEAIRFRRQPYDIRSFSDDIAAAIYEDESGTLWIGTGGRGVARLDFRARKFAHYRHDPEDPVSLGGDYVQALYEDREGMLWVGTWGAGLDRFDRRTGTFTHFRHDPADSRSLGSDIVSAIHEDRMGTLWVGTNGDGLNRFDRLTGAFVSYSHDPRDPQSLGSDYVLALHEDRAGTLWLGTWDGGLNRFDGAASGAAGSGAAGPGGGKFIRYMHDAADPVSLSGNKVYAIHEDHEGRLWASAEAAGLNRLDAGAFKRFAHDEDDPSSLSNNDVMVIYEDRSEVLWVGTYGGGLNRFDFAGGTFSSYRERDGLPNDVVYGILEDGEGRLWLSTNKGLARFDPRTETFRNYDHSDGLQGQEFNSGAYHKSRRNVLYFGGINGFNAFFPDRVEDNPHVPPVVLTSFKKFNEEVSFDTAVAELRAITLPYEDNVISFGFAALNYSVPEKNRYAYKLEGFSDEWSELGTKRDITFTNLNPGSYVFRVKGSNNDGVWNEQGLAVGLTILPPFWSTWWFRTLSVASLVLAILVVYQLRTLSVRNRNRQLEAMNRQLEAVNAELEAKNAELERFTYTVSHDLKSPLVTIKGFLGFLLADARAGNQKRMERDAAQISAAADKMGHLLDELLELSRIGRMMNPPIAVSLTDLAREAAGLVAGKIEDRGVTVDIEPHMPVVIGDRVRLAEVLQNLIDNAVSFIGEQPDPWVEVSARLNGDDVLCRVRDNGVGIDPRYHEKVFGLFDRLHPETEGTGIGLALVKRIVEVHGGRVWVESQGAGQGSTFCFTLPGQTGESR